jgi:hypothetical protein
MHVHRKARLAGAAIATATVAIVAGGGVAQAVSTAAPHNVVRPSISGTPREGQTLTANPGHWSGSQPIDYSYQWRRCGPAGGNCVNIPQATDKLYVVRNDDVGNTLRVVVTAVNSDGANSAVSPPTDQIKPVPAQAPSNTALPSINGKAQVGETLSANAGSWSGSQPIDFSYRWRRCDDKGGNCVNTPVTSQTYRLTTDDAGHTLRVLVTASNSAGAGAALSNPTSPVGGVTTTPSTTTPPGSCAPISQVTLPERLIVDQIQWNPRTISQHGQTVVGRFHVTTTKARCVSGALVYAVGVPFDRLSAAPEQPTGGDGWATVTFRVLPTFQLRPGNFVVVFVRARKPGDSVLAGVSTRRLVSVRVG